MKHTPGPWKVIKMEGSEDLYIESRNKPGWNEFPIASLIPYKNAEELANARLIASAPELLEACKEIVAIFHKEANEGRYPKFLLGKGWLNLANAIAKAEGK